jgi:AcrR family transcriptional regulator
MITDEQEGRKAGRPRSVEAHQAILDATLSLLATQGFEAMSIEEVATRAGVGKTTIYRWWASKEDLALEALQSLYAKRRPILNTGNLRHDLITMIEDFTQLMEGEEGMLLGDLTFKLLGELKTHPKLLKMFYSRIVEPRLQQFTQRVEHAQERGELRQDLDPLVLFMLFGGPCFYRMLLSGAIVPCTPHWAEQIVDAALNGAAAHHDC